MGLYTSHGCWHGSYSSFNEWRRSIAQALGFELDEMVGFGTISRDGLTPKLATREWASLPPTPLHLLLNHSDCDGEIKAKDCLPIADALEELLPSLKDDGPWSTAARARHWIAGLRQAARAGEPVEFR